MSVQIGLRFALFLWASIGAREAFAQRTWEVNGIRLEEAQIERLADDIARQTVEATRRLEGVRLSDAQAVQLEAIYRSVALDVYDEAVEVAGRTDVDDETKERQIIALVLAGQERSTEQVAQVLEPDQYAVYRRWEERQVEAFRQRGLWSKSRRRRGRGR